MDHKALRYPLSGEKLRPNVTTTCLVSDLERNCIEGAFDGIESSVESCNFSISYFIRLLCNISKVCFEHVE